MKELIRGGGTDEVSLVSFTDFMYQELSSICFFEMKLMYQVMKIGYLSGENGEFILLLSF